ncbi:hypothetical protein GT3570_09955 [Geobacillus thermoleovorans]|nr:hypothetical protein GT3570_09955 [Geobacillus thermoleovorans]
MVEKCVKCNRHDVELLKTGDLCQNHIELMCEPCILAMYEERIKKENMVCDECGGKVYVYIDDEIAWFACTQDPEHMSYGEYLLEPFDPLEGESRF